MACVIAQGDGRAVLGADAALRAQDEEFGPAQEARVPAHARVLAEAKEVAAGRVQEHFLVEGQAALRPGRVGLDIVQAGVICINRQWKVRRGAVSFGHGDQPPDVA